MFRYVYSKMTENDLDGFWKMTTFKADKTGELVSEPFTESDLEEDIKGYAEYGMSIDEARDYIMSKVKEE